MKKTIVWKKKDLKSLNKANTKIVSEDNWHSVFYHNTPVLSFNPVERKVKLQNGGFSTQTTKKRINQASELFGLNVQVYQERFVWYVNNKETEFEDGIEIPVQYFDYSSIPEYVS